jgi:prephenate dehydrogenase (NADP+)
MIKEEEVEFPRRLYRARDFVFHESRKPIMLNDSVMKEFSLSQNRTPKAQFAPQYIKYG